MLTLNKILVPIDFSRASGIAVQHGIALARRFHSEVTLLHVNEFPALQPFSGPLGFGIASETSERVAHVSRRREQLENFGAEELKGISVKRLICDGDPAKRIVDAGKEADLIVMPTHGHGRFRRLLLGSVTAKVLHDTDCAVWTGAHLEEGPALNPGEIRQVMCAVNLESPGAKTLRWAAAFAADVGAALTVVNAVWDHPHDLPERFRLQWHEEAQWTANERIRALLRDLAIDANVMVAGGGDIPGTLAVAVKDKRAELLVIGRMSAGDASCHTYAIVCNAPCPVVSV